MISREWGMGDPVSPFPNFDGCADTEQQETRNTGAVGATGVASKEPGLVPFLTQFINERGIEKAFRFELARGGISLSFDIQDKLNRRPVRRQVLA